MKRKGPGGKEVALHVLRSELPIDLFVAPEIWDVWSQPVSAATVELQSVVGRPLFTTPTKLTVGVRDIMQNPSLRRYIRAFVILPGDLDLTAEADIWYGPRGEILNTVAHFPADPSSWPMQTQTNVAMHELGHGLGLAHDTRPKSLMYPRTNSRVFLTQADKDLLLTHYGKGQLPMS